MRIILALALTAAALAAQDSRHPQELLGAWERQIPALKLTARYELAAEGPVSGRLGGAAGDIALEGTWEVVEGRLVVTTNTADFAGAYRLEGDRLVVEGVGELVRIPGPAATGTANLAPAELILGIWERSEGEATSRYVFRGGGQFTHIVKKGDQEKIEDGTWNLADVGLDLTTGEFVPKTVTLPHPGFPDERTMIFNEKSYRRLSGGSIAAVPVTKEALVGLWWDRDQSGELTYRFDSTGRFLESIRLANGKGRDVVGRYRLEGDLLTLVNEENDGQKKAKLVLTNRDLLLFDLGEDARYDVRRLSAEDVAVAATKPAAGDCEEPAPAPTPAKGGVAGNWLIKAEGISALVVFGADGRYSREWTEEGKTTRANGTWAEKGELIEIMDSEEGRMQIPFKLLQPDLLELVIDGEAVRFRREGAKLGLPRELVGIWAIADDTGSVRLELGADASFKLDLSDTRERHHFEGLALHSPGRLDLEDRASGRTIPMPYRLDGQVLRVELGETDLALQKQP